ncbi:anthranilate synthase component I family protein [Microbacterium radiodurans]|uniref:anthranilate synthase component I family protein n=1 Tax=Microbacterium radiodurans TaxID=661398 RepID=UPI00168AF2EB|nr:anthranilate synthase component I family protein [Microbacterium radiodurans]
MPDTPATHQRVAWTDPATVFAGIVNSHAFWLDGGVDATGGWSWVGVGEPDDRPDVSFASASRTGRVPTSPAGPFLGGWVGWESYDAAALLAGAPARVDATAPASAWMRVTRLVAFDHEHRECWLVAEPREIDAFATEAAGWVERGTASLATRPAPAPQRTAEARVAPDRYAELIGDCRAAIRRGDAYQLCLTTRFSVTDAAAIDPLDVFLRLRAATSSHHGGLIRIGRSALASASPERFIQVDDDLVRTSPIKGTRPRGEDRVADDRLAADLLSSPKERAENVMIVDLMRNDLQRVCRPGSVVVEKLLTVESYPAVHQLVSTVVGTLDPGTAFADLLSATFPAGSMTGAPKLSAMTLLHGLEGAPRGAYAGCFGWVGADGSAADLAMVIRSVVFHPGGAYVGAGGGITWLSNADEEVAEVAVKARAPLAALGASLPPRWAERVR